MIYFSKDKVITMPHPNAQIDDDKFMAITQAADRHLKEKYGNLPSSSEVIKVKLEKANKATVFDSADYQLQLYNLKKKMEDN